MHGLWPWILLGLLGAYHGLNPAMGWLFAVALGMQEGDRRAVVRALPAIAIGHEASILVIAVVVLGLGVITDPSALHVGAGVALIAFGLFRFVKPRAHDSADLGLLNASIGVGAVGIALHVIAMLAVMGVVAVVVYERLGLKVLRTAWINTDKLWAGAFVLAAFITLAS